MEIIKTRTLFMSFLGPRLRGCLEMKYYPLSVRPERRREAPKSKDEQKNRILRLRPLRGLRSRHERSKVTLKFNVVRALRDRLHQILYRRQKKLFHRHPFFSYKESTSGLVFLLKHFNTLILWSFFRIVNFNDNEIIILANNKIDGSIIIFPVINTNFCSKCRVYKVGPNSTFS